MAFAPRIPSLPRAESSSNGRRSSLGRSTDSIQPPVPAIYQQQQQQQRSRSNSISSNNNINNIINSSNYYYEGDNSRRTSSSTFNHNNNNNILTSDSTNVAPLPPSFVNTHSSLHESSSSSSSKRASKFDQRMSNAEDVLAKFHATKQEYDTHETLQQADRLQQRLLWKEQMERSSALETQIMTNKRTMANLERQLEQLKRELANERQSFDNDLRIKESKLEEAKRSLENRKRRYETTMSELRETNAAIARMRAVLVEHFVLSKSYSSGKVEIGNPHVDVTGEDYKFYKHYAGAELEKRHQVLIERYIGGKNSTQNATTRNEERAFAVDPFSGRNGNNDNATNSGEGSGTSAGRRFSLRDQQRRKSLQSSSLADEAEYLAAKNRDAEENGKEKFVSKRKKGLYDPKDKTAALNDVRDMLFELEKELFEAENEIDASSVASPDKKKNKNNHNYKPNNNKSSVTQEEVDADAFSPKRTLLVRKR